MSRLARSLLAVAALTGTATAAEPLTLERAIAQALQPIGQGELARSRRSIEQASGAVAAAEGAFDWAAGTMTGYTRVYQPGSSGGFLTTDVQRFDVASSTIFAERQLQNGIRVRPGVIVTQEPQDFRPDLARLGNRPLLQVDIPLDRSLGEPADALRLEAARSELSVAQTGGELARQAHLHRVVVAVWRLLAAQERAAVDRELAARLAAAAERARRLSRSGEAAASAADEMLGRTALAESLIERDGIEILAARMELALLLGMEIDGVPGVRAQFPAIGAGEFDAGKQSALVAEALRQRPELKAQAGRVEAARLRGRILEREAESRMSFTLAQDRLMFSWYAPLGDNRGSGARRQSLASVEAAEDALTEARHRVRMETTLGIERLAAARRSVGRAAAAVDAMRERMVATERLVQGARQPAAALADAADQLAVSRRHLIEAQLAHALALADLRRATAAIPEGAAQPEVLATLFTTLP